MNKILHPLILTACMFFISVISTQIFANENNKPVADESFNGTTLAFSYKGNFSNATLTVSGPNGLYISKVIGNGIPALDLSELGALPDGLYTYELSVATDKFQSNNSGLDNGRGLNEKTIVNIGARQSGIFRINKGSMDTHQVVANLEESATTLEGE